MGWTISVGGGWSIGVIDTGKTRVAARYLVRRVRLGLMPRFTGRDVLAAVRSEARLATPRAFSASSYVGLLSCGLQICRPASRAWSFFQRQLDNVGSGLDDRCRQWAGRLPAGERAWPFLLALG